MKTKPSQIVFEDLNVKGMMKNKHLSKAIVDQKFYEFRRQITYKAERGRHILCQFKDMFVLLKLSDRVYHCSVCGKSMDRDGNAAINLANYKIQNVS